MTEIDYNFYLNVNMHPVQILIEAVML